MPLKARVRLAAVLNNDTFTKIMKEPFVAWRGAVKCVALLVALNIPSETPSFRFYKDNVYCFLG